MYRRFGIVSVALALVVAAAPADAQRIPPGSYQQSCTHIRVRGNELIARCSAPNGRRITSRLPLFCRGDIGNVNGYLRCNHRYRR